MHPIPNRSVLLVGNHLSATVGNRAIAEEMAERLVRRGWRVRAASRKAVKLPRLADMLSTCWRCRSEYAVAVVDVFSGPAFLWAEAVCFALRALGKPYVLVLRGGGLPEFAAARRRRVSRLLASAAAVVAPSGYLVERMAACRRDIRLIPNAIHLPDYPFRLRARPAPRLVWLRSFHEIYNPPMAVAALALLARDVPGASLLMVGPDKGDGSLARAREAAQRLGVADRVEFHGVVPKTETGRWIDRGDIFLNTTNVDNMPVTVVEAMACGACVVSTGVGGIPYILEHERDALLVPPGDPPAMAAGVRRILSEPDLASGLSSRARAAAAAWDWSAVLDGWESLLLGIGRPLPGRVAAERGFQS